MAELYRSDIADVDISKPLLRTYAGILLATGDKNANRFGANIFRAGEPVDLTGCTVLAYFIRPNADTLPIDGVVEGNTAYVDLPSACYTNDGAFSLAIKISGTDITNTVRVIDGCIRLTQTDTLVDPGEVVPSLDDLLAQIADMEAATTAAETAVAEYNQRADAQDASIDSLHKAVFDKAPLTLPVEHEGTVDVTLADGAQVITGTHNVIGLMQLKQGTLELNGLTVTVEGNTVSISGTPTINMNLSLHTWDNGLSYLTSGEPQIPERLYTLSQKVTSGSVFPNVGIRSKSSGMVTYVQNNTAQYTHDHDTCGHLYAVISKTKTYDCTFVLALLPYATTNSSPYRDQTSEVQAITESGQYVLNGYTWADGEATVEIAESKLPKRCKCRYEQRTVSYTGASEVLDVYIPAAVGYVHVLFGRSVGVDSEGGAYDNWRILQFASVNNAYVKRFNVTQLGETEMAVKINGRSDFIGGYTHGDEVMLDGSLIVLVDGRKVDITSLTDLTEFDELRITEATAMYDPADHTTQVGVHGREYVITTDGVTLNQTVEWLGAYTLDASYMPMLCAIRGADAVSDMQVTDTYIDNGSYQPYDVSVGGFTTYPNDAKTDVSRVMLLSDKSGICATVDVLETPDLPGRCVYLYNGVDTYNKVYCAVCGYSNQHTTAAGEKWRVRAHIQIEVGEGDDVT